ncbi:hypothetical protein D1871_05440 [Nakamurella silvestris]|nr:hypothetical protein D1871_05440 [Nakamurella silvestris]
MTAAVEPSPGPEQTPAGAVATRGAADWLLVAFCCLLVVVATLLSLAFLPSYLGSTPFPISALVVGVVLVWAIRACYKLLGSLWAASAPLLIWFLLVGYLAFAPYLGSSLVPGYFGYPLVARDWRLTVQLAIGALVGAGVLGGIWGDHLAAKIRAEQSEGPRGGAAGPLT